MSRRYVRGALEMFERRDISFLEFPSGEGPPIYMSISRGEWHRLGLGQGRTVSLDGSEGGAFAFGLTATVAVVWIHTPPGAPGIAYCYHAPPGPLDARAHEAALAAIGCARSDSEHLYVLIAAMRALTQDDEQFFLERGVRSDRLFTYSNSFLPQFGVSAGGYVGEAT